MNTSSVPAAVLVGYAGRDSDAALEWAITEAARRTLPLRALHAYADNAEYPWAWSYPVPAFEIQRAQKRLRATAESVLTEAGELVKKANFELPFTATLSIATPGEALVTASAEASLLVVGHRRHPVVGTLGSTAAAVAARAKCPVVVVPDVPAVERARDEVDTRFSGSVVVGLENSPECEGALGFAFQQASARGLRLVSLHAFWVDAQCLPTGDRSDRHQVDAKAQAAVEVLLAPWRARFPGVETRLELGGMRPADALVEASRRAELVVVGSRGRGGFSSLLLGSVSRKVLHRAHCPVAVVRRGQLPAMDDIEVHQAEEPLTTS